MSQVTIEEELELVFQRVPDFAPRVKRAIENGLLNSCLWSSCFYGQVCAGNRREAKELQQNISRILDLPFRAARDKPETPIEDLVDGVLPGETPETHKGVATLYEALMPYLPAGVTS